MLIANENKISRKKVINFIYSSLQYILIVSIVLTNTIWTHSTSIPIDQGKLTFIFSISCLILCMFLFRARKSIKIKFSLLKKILVVICVLMGSTVTMTDNTITYILYYAIPLVICILYFGLEINIVAFWRKFTNIIVIICAISLFFFFFGSVLKIIPPTGKIQYKWTWEVNTNNWYNLYYEASFGRFSTIPFLPRKNTGIYTEPPMYTIIVCLAIAGELSFVHTPRKKQLVILFFTLLTIMSTTGYLFILLVIGLFLTKIDKKKRTSAIKIIILPIILLVAMIVVLEIMNQKIGDIAGEESVNIRTDHLMTSLRLWVEKPIFGIGYGQSELFKQSARFHQGASIGLPVFLAYAGIWGTSIYFIPFFKSLFVSIKYNKQILYFILGTFLILFLTSVFYLPFMMVIMAMLFVCMESHETHK